MNFDRAVSILLDIEKGYANNPKDPGGATNWGISQKTFPDLDIRNLTREAAVEIYRRKYWDEPRISSLPPYIRLLVFDSAVNQGQGSAILFLQEALSVPRDGSIGPVTIKAAFSAAPTVLIGNYIRIRQRRYELSLGYDSSGKSWLNRLIRVSFETLISMGDENAGSEN